MYFVEKIKKRFYLFMLFTLIYFICLPCHFLDVLLKILFQDKNPSSKKMAFLPIQKKSSTSATSCTCNIVYSLLLYRHQKCALFAPLYSVYRAYIIFYHNNKPATRGTRKWSKHVWGCFLALWLVDLSPDATNPVRSFSVISIEQIYLSTKDPL